MSERPIGILVLGMHRSGTSAVTGVLEKLGIPVPGESLPPAPDNPKGFFENKAAFEFNHGLLNRFQSRWDDPLPIARASVARLLSDPALEELKGIIRREFLDRGPIFACKDPSTCRFMPIWRAALDELGVDAKVLVPLRHPLDVAGSLAARDGIPRAKGLLVWLQHMLPAERETRDMTRSFLPYDDLMADWRGATSRVAGELDLRWPWERARVEAAVDDFLSRDLRHHHCADGSFGEDAEATELDRLAARAWNSVSALARDRTDAGAMASLDEVSARLDEAAKVFGSYVAWEFRSLVEARERVTWLEDVERIVRAEGAGYFHQVAALDAERHRQVAALEATAAEREAFHAQALEDARQAAAKERNRQNADHRRTLARELGTLRREADEAAGRLGAEVASLRPLAERAGALEGEAAQLRQALHTESAALLALRASTFWRLTSPLRRLAGALPPSSRRWLRRGAKAGLWTATPWRTGARLRFLRERNAAALRAPEIAASVTPAPAPARPIRRGSSTQAPLALFAVPEGPRRLSMVTDSINAGSLFGGVATALIFSALLAKETGRRLRVVTRTQGPDAGNVATVFRAHGIEWEGNVEFAFADANDEGVAVDAAPDELFVTTSWWTTDATRASVPKSRILYLLQEDERMFYPFGDDALACAEVLGDRAIRKVVNSALLHRHLAADGIVGAETPFFEPSFPERIYFPDPKAAGKRNFFFYARPHNARNLYERGVAVIEAALERGILDPERWDIHFVGKDLAPTVLAGGVEPILLQNMPWEDYAAYVRSVDLALTLMYTPHPSYPPLDVAACGGVAVTNRFGVKTDLSGYSRSILTVDSDVDALVEGLRLGVTRALDAETRERDFAANGIGRDWEKSFAPVFQKLAEDGRRVR